MNGEGWSDQELPPVASYSWAGSSFELWPVLLSVAGAPVGPSLGPFIPEKWSRSAWPYVALLRGPHTSKGFDREFFGKAGKMGRGGSLLLAYDPDQVPLSSLVEIRAGLPGQPDRYQRIFRLDLEGWSFVAYRQEDVGGWDRYHRRPRFRRFYPWEVVQGEQEAGAISLPS